MSHLSEQPSRAGWPLWIAWLVIAGLATVIFAYGGGAGRAPAMADKLNEVRVKFVLYVRSFGAAGSARLTDDVGQLLRQIEQESTTPPERFHFAIITGEILGGPAALEKLDALASVPHSADLSEDIATTRQIYVNGPLSLDSASRSRLTTRHDFFGRVALSFNVAPGEEPRKTIEDHVKSFGLVMMLVSLGLIGIVTLSLGAFVLAIVLGVKGKIQPRYRPDPAAGSSFLEGFALYMVLFFAFAGVLRRVLGLTSLGWEWLATAIIPIVMAWTAWRGATPEARRQAFGWHTGEGWYKEVAAGFAGYFAGLPIVAVGIFFTWLIVTATGVQPAHPITWMLGGGVWQVLGLYALACVWAPVVEETMFRGALFHHMRRRWRWLPGALLVSFIFAVLHPQGWAAIPALGSIALVLAALREWRGSILAPMTAHACNNFVVLTISLMLLR